MNAFVYIMFKFFLCRDCPASDNGNKIRMDLTETIQKQTTLILSQSKNKQSNLKVNFNKNKKSVKLKGCNKLDFELFEQLMRSCL